MTHEPDFARNACAFTALYFGWTSLYALEPRTMMAAALFALMGMWFALAASFDELAEPCENLCA